MHKSNYRPTKSQQLYLTSLVKKGMPDYAIFVHHVLEDTPYRLFLQIEARYMFKVDSPCQFMRIEL